ncbi:unnamed protein product [Discosporangium mesarthrocarpum]
MADVEGNKAEIKRTFALVEPIAATAATLFYGRLWDVYPETKGLFEDTDMESQKEKLMKTLGVAVSMLNDLDGLVPILQDLGRRHIDYGVKANMYPMVMESLLWTLEKGLGEEWTPEAAAAWGWVLGVIQGVCIDAAREIDPTYGDVPPKC